MNFIKYFQKHQLTFYLFLFLLTFGEFPQTYAIAQSFECSFMRGKLPPFKPNAAVCTMDPEKAFSSKKYTAKPDDHCQITTFDMMGDLVDFLVDVNEKKVTFSSRTFVKYIEEAEPKLNLMKYEFAIDGYVLGSDKILFDPIEIINVPPKKVPMHIINFSNEDYTYSLYFPEVSGKAILSQYNSQEEASWIQLRFGRCRKKN